MDQRSDILESVKEHKSQHLISDDNSMEFESYDNDLPEIKCKLQQEIEEIQSKLTEIEN